jgi:YVTN family beta-propeller protein/VCBS repeat-containing protein
VGKATASTTDAVTSRKRQRPGTSHHVQAGPTSQAESNPTPTAAGSEPSTTPTGGAAAGSEPSGTTAGGQTPADGGTPASGNADPTAPPKTDIPEAPPGTEFPATGEPVTVPQSPEAPKPRNHDAGNNKPKAATPKADKTSAATVPAQRPTVSRSTGSASEKPVISATQPSASSGATQSATDAAPSRAASTAAVTTLTADVPTVKAPTAPSAVGVLTGIVDRVLTGFAASLGLGQTAASGPAGPAPVGTPGVWALMAFARRQLGLDSTPAAQTATPTTTLAASTVTAQAAAANQPPTLNPQQTGYVVDQGLVYTIGTLNGSDPEGAPLTYTTPSTGTGAPQHGVVVVDAANNFWAHVATKGYTGTDTFTISVTDGTNTVSKQVTITVPAVTANNPPVVNPTTPYTIDPAQPGDYQGMVRGHVNVTDPNQDALTYTGTGNTAKGYVQIDTTTGRFVYVPTAAASHAASATNAGSTGANRDTFTVTVSDGRGGTVAVPVTVSIAGVNTAPFAYSGPTVNAPNANGVVTGNLNVFDNEGDALTYTVTSSGKGQVVVAADGSFTYTPTIVARMQAAGTPGTDLDSFSVNVIDGHGGTTTVAVSQITIAPGTPSIGQSVAVGDFPLDVTVSKDGKRIYVVNFNASTISVIDATTGATIGNPIPVGYFPISASVNPAGTAVYVSSSYLETVDIINTATNTVTSSFNVGRHPGAISFSPDGTKMYVLNFTNGTLSAYDTATNTPVSTVAVGARPMRMALSTDGTRAYVLNSTDNTVSIVNTSTMSVVGSPIAVGRGDNFTDIAVTPDGSKAYVTNAQDGTVTVINTATRATSTVNVGASPWGVAVSPDGSAVYVTNGYSNSVSIISTATNTVISTVQFSGTYLPISVAFSPDGKQAYVTRVSYGSSPNGDVVVINTVSDTTSV